MTAESPIMDGRHFYFLHKVVDPCFLKMTMIFESKCILLCLLCNFRALFINFMIFFKHLKLKTLVHIYYYHIFVVPVLPII